MARSFFGHAPGFRCQHETGVQRRMAWLKGRWWRARFDAASRLTNLPRAVASLSDAQNAEFILSLPEGCERDFLCALHGFAFERVGVLRCNMVAPTLSRPLRGLRQGVAQFTFALKTLRCERLIPLRSKRFAVSALEFLDAARLRRLAPDRASRGGAKRRAVPSSKQKVRVI